VLAPEERHVGKALALSEDLPRHGLALAFGHHLLLDPKMLAAVGICPP
jgi:hypothetical protein